MSTHTLPLPPSALAVVAGRQQQSRAREGTAPPPVTAALLAGLLAGYGIAVPVGAVGTYLVSLTARTSLRTGVSAALGVATADGLYALAAVLGGSALASALRPALGPLRWVCVLVLTALAAWGAARAVRQYRGRAADRPHRVAAPGPAPGVCGAAGDHPAQPDHGDLLRGAGARLAGRAGDRGGGAGRVRDGGVRGLRELAGPPGRRRRPAGPGADRSPGPAGDGAGGERVMTALALRDGPDPGLRAARPHEIRLPHIKPGRTSRTAWVGRCFLGTDTPGPEHTRPGRLPGAAGRER